MVRNFKPSFIADLAVGKEVDFNKSVAVARARQICLSLILNACRNIIK
jgi:hypothetical protein